MLCYLRELTYLLRNQTRLRIRHTRVGVIKVLHLMAKITLSVKVSAATNRAKTEQKQKNNHQIAFKPFCCSQKFAQVHAVASTDYSVIENNTAKTISPALTLIHSYYLLSAVTAKN